jgi:molecular chaperone DnaJ
LGTELEVETFDGLSRLKIPEGTQPETVFKIKGKGIPRLRGFGRGDLLVKVKVEVPRRLNVKQKQILRDFAQAFGEKPPSSEKEEKGFFHKVKDALGGN